MKKERKKERKGKGEIENSILLSSFGSMPEQRWF